MINALISDIIIKIKNHQFCNVYGFVSDHDTWGIGLTITPGFDDNLFSFDPHLQQSLDAALNIIPSLTPGDSVQPQLMIDYKGTDWVITLEAWDDHGMLVISTSVVTGEAKVYAILRRLLALGIRLYDVLDNDI